MENKIKAVQVITEEKADMRIPSVEDTYVINGESAPMGSVDSNYGNAPLLHFKGNDGSGCLHRRVLLKFDISALDDADFVRASLSLKGVAAQSHDGATMYIYAIDPDSWKQNEVTFNTAPTDGEHICTSYSAGNGGNLFDISDYLKRAVKEGRKIVSFLLVGDSRNPLHVQYASSRHGGEQGPAILVSFCQNGFLTNVNCADGAQAAWDHAVGMVEEWMTDWEAIKARGDAKSETVYEDPEEYALSVDVTRTPTVPYVKHPTRILDTIKGYEPVKDGEAKYDEYGGYICDIKFDKAPYYRVEKKDGRFWCVTPEGNPFYRLAMVLLSPGASENQRKVVLEKCGSLENWIEHETKHMREDLYFNSLGGWSATEALSKAQKPLALSQISYFLTGYTRMLGTNNSTGGNTTFVGGAMPVFDPGFAEFCENHAAKVVAPYAGNKNFFGWMSDNELHAEGRLLDTYLMLDCQNPLFAYSYATAWTFLRAVTGKNEVSAADITDEYRKQFRAMIYNRYLKLVSTATKKYDPDHLFMGCRFLPGCYRDEYVHRVAGAYCDIISLNYYGAWQPESDLMANIQKWSDTPFIITEWYAKGMDAATPETRLTNMSGAGFTVPTQKDRGHFYHNYTLKLMECKGCVGFDWFQCWDNDPDNLRADLSNRNSNKGIYNNNYEEYTELTDAMKRVNANAYKLIQFFDSETKRSH